MAFRVLLLLSLSLSLSLLLSLLSLSLSLTGGTFSGGSQFFNTVVIRKPAHQLLLELNVPFVDKENYVTIQNPNMLVSALLNKTLNNSKSEFVFLGNLDVCDYLFRADNCVGISGISLSLSSSSSLLLLLLLSFIGIIIIIINNSCIW